MAFENHRCFRGNEKKVLFTANYIRVVNRFLIPYLKWFQDNGWETWVAANNDHMDGSEVPEYCDHFILVDFSRNPFSRETVIAYRQLVGLLREERFDLIHTHTPIAAALTRIVAYSARKHGTSVLYTAHGFHFYRGAPVANWFLWFPIECVLSHFTDLLITINHEDYMRARRFMHCNVEYVPGVGIDLSRFSGHSTVESLRANLGIKPDDYLLLSVGDLISRKNQIQIIRALAILPERCKLALCGEGPDRQKLEKVACDLGVEDRVSFLGYRNDIPSIMKAADCLVFPSVHEGLPVSVMEAMAAGLPVVASSIRGIDPDLIENRVSGLLLKKSTPDNIALCVLDLINDPTLARSIANKAFDKVQEFDVNAIVKKMAKIYESAGAV